MSQRSSVMIGMNKILRRRLRAGRDEGVALLSVMLFMLLLTGVSFVLLGIILGQIAPSYAAQKGTKTVYAAQAGLQSTLAVIRTIASPPDAATGTVFGNLSKLPCTVAGAVDGATNDITYTATVTYHLTDPTGKPAGWENQAGNFIACTGAGPTEQPNFALIVSRGTGTSTAGIAANEGNRSIAAVYKFRITNINVPGGRVWDIDETKCLQAMKLGGTVKAGSELKFVTGSQCKAANDDAQLWVHDASYQIKLAISLEGGAAGLCITGVPGNNATLQPCAPKTAADSARYSQLWGWTGATTWIGQKNPISAGPSNAALSITSGNFLEVRNGASSQLAPDAAVGAGAAGKSTNQIVNYKEFGRCLDVTNEQVGSAYMIVYPCKQDPTGTLKQLKWNHKWYYTEAEPGVALTQSIYINLDDNTSKRYCLKTPAKTPAKGFVTFTAACSATAADQKWTRYNQMGTYANSYVFVDTFGRCLTADSTTRHANQYSEVSVQTCDGSTAQKWNAPAASNDAEFGGYKEVG